MTAGAIERLGELANQDTWLAHRGRFLDVTFLVEVGQTSYLIRIHRGRIEGIERARSSCRAGPSRCALPEEAWSTFWTAVPPPGFHDLIAMLKVRALRIEGDQHPFMANLRYFKDLLALPRARSGGAR